VYRAGFADLAAGRFDSAIRRIPRAGALLGWTPAMRVALGDAYFGQGDRTAAIAQWELALADLPQDDALLARLAASYEALGQYPQALDILNRRLQTGALDPALLYRLALLTAATRPGEANARLEVAASTPSQFASNAAALLQALREAQAANDEAYLFGRVGYELIQLQEWALAEHALTQAVTLNPQYADAYAYLGLAQDSQGRDGKAAYESAVQSAPNSALAQYLFGLHYRRLGQSAQAVPYLKAAQALDPQNPALAAELGGAYAAQNDLINAEKWLSEAVALAPRDAQFWLLLARFHVDNEYKVPEQGLPAARMAVGLNPESALAADAFGYALIITGDTVNGQKSLERALSLDPNLASAYYHFGLYYAAQNLPAEARVMLNHALALDPQGPYGSLALKALSLLGP
jgi:tetratricopeptide (TPR) repeat protein